MGKVTGLEDIHHVPPKVNQMYEAVMQLLEEGADVADIRVSTITERAGIGKGTAYEYFDTKEEIVACAIVYHIQRLFSWLEETLEAQRDFRAQVTFLLDTVEQKNRCKEGFLRFVHMMTSNSGFDRMVREKMNEEAAVSACEYIREDSGTGRGERGAAEGSADGLYDTLRLFPSADLYAGDGQQGLLPYERDCHTAAGVSGNPGRALRPRRGMRV